MRFRHLIALGLTACATATPGVAPNVVPDAWTRVETAPRIDAAGWRDGHVVAGLSDSAAGPTAMRIVRTATGEKIVNGAKDVTPSYAAIDSFDYLPERHEVIFSAKRDKSFDIGLAADDGSEIHWVPEDPADETNVKWAPAGNKVTFLVRGKIGTLVRTVHVPTSTQLTVDFPFASIRSFAYEPSGQRYAVVYSTPDASDRIESVKYGGEERRLERAPAAKLDVNVDRRGDAVLLTPAALRYNERLPLVVWIASDPLAWNDARAALMRRSRLACAVMAREPDAAFWTSMRELPWVDPNRFFVVGSAASEQPATVIMASTDVPAGHFVQRRNFVLVPAGIVESFAAGFVADQLKGTSPSDGHQHR
jgi:hypothetical protein